MFAEFTPSQISSRVLSPGLHGAGSKLILVGSELLVLTSNSAGCSKPCMFSLSSSIMYRFGSLCVDIMSLKSSLISERMAENCISRRLTAVSGMVLDRFSYLLGND